MSEASGREKASRWLQHGLSALLVVIIGLNVWWFASGQEQAGGHPLVEGPAPALTLPELSLTGAQGEPVSLDALKGKVVLIDFWATYCVPCKRQMPVLERLHKTLPASRFVVLSVNIDPGGASRHHLVSSYIKNSGYTFPVVLDDGQAKRDYQVRRIPTMFLVSPSGEIAFVHSGLMSEKGLREKIDALIENDEA